MSKCPDEAGRRRFEEELESARRGDVAALGRLLEAEGDFLDRFARKILPAELAGAVEAADLVQETFMDASRCFAQFQGEIRQEWRGWLRRTLLRRLLAHKRRGRRGSPEGDAAVVDARRGPQAIDPRTTPARAVIRRERMQALLRAADQLPDEYRMVVHWHHVEGCTFKEIGQRLGKSEEAARKLRDRALKRLKAILGPGHDSGWEPANVHR